MVRIKIVHVNHRIVTSRSFKNQKSFIVKCDRPTYIVDRSRRGEVCAIWDVSMKVSKKCDNKLKESDFLRRERWSERKDYFFSLAAIAFWSQLAKLWDPQRACRELRTYNFEFRK